MKHKITSVTELGTLIRATRKSVDMRLDDLAATSNLSKQFVNDVELGKPGVQLGKVLQVLQELGVHMYIDVPDSVNDQLAHARNLITKTTERRHARSLGQVALTSDSDPMSTLESGTTQKPGP
jgi:transcriptional regulator with XRE-family HTH domain